MAVSSRYTPEIERNSDEGIDCHRMILRRTQPSEVKTVREWIKQHHYLKSTPPGQIVALEFLAKKKRIGAILIGRPTSRELDPDRILELTRMYFVDEAGFNTESKALAMMRKFIRTWFPTVQLLIAYSDSTAGHSGTIYAADNWAPFGKTKHSTGYGWKSREGRRETQCWPKQRWVRTP